MNPFGARPAVGIFRTVFPLGSETFIREQISAMTAFIPSVVTRDWVAPYAGHAVVNLESVWRRNVWTLTRWPSAFPLERLRALRLLHAHFGQDAVMALPLAERLRLPLITTFHGADITTNRAQFAAARKPTERWFARKEGDLIKQGSAFVAVSRFVESKVIACGYPSERVHQIYIGVDVQRFVPQPGLNGPRYLLCVARHTPKKGLDTLIKAWARIADRHPEVELWQVGGGGITSRYIELASAQGVSGRMRFMGALDHREVLRLMQRAEAFVLPSQTADDGDSEALGIVFNEASACGVPVISTLHGGIPEAVRHGETGLLSAERDDRALANHMDAVLSDRAFGARLGRRGREFACDLFDIRKQTPKLEALYASLIEN